jgi:hypothetical protein
VDVDSALFEPGGILAREYEHTYAVAALLQRRDEVAAQ